MTHQDYDDGLVHGHGWANCADRGRVVHPVVADASGVNTPSSVFNDDLHQDDQPASVLIATGQGGNSQAR